MAKTHLIIPQLQWQEIARFWAWVTVRGSHECWPWRGVTFGGYGTLWLRNHKCRASRIAWTIANGPIPDGLIIMHLCDNPSCCNPSHLRAGTQAENDADRTQKGRSACGEKHGRHTKPRRWARSGRSGNAKLTASKVREIRDKYKAGGVTQQELATTYNITQSAVSRLALRQSWQHIV